MKRYAEIIGTGSFLPETVLTNDQLETMVETSDEWITSRTGIKERRLADKDHATSDLAVVAGERALACAGVSPEEVDLLVVGTSTPDHILPSTASIVQDKMGLSCGAFDVNAVCTGFIYALHTGVTAIESGRAETVLVIGADKLTRHIDFTDYSIGIPAFLTLTIMPFTYSITNGIGAGFVSWTLIQIFTGKAREVKPLMWVVTAAFVVYFAYDPISTVLGVS